MQDPPQVAHVIHGAIDGFSRLVLHLHAANNNRAATTLEAFVESVNTHGLPLKARSDKGKENVLVADFMIANRGNTGMITGRSVHNQRIERLWRDVWDGVGQRYHASLTLLVRHGLPHSAS